MFISAKETLNLYIEYSNLQNKLYFKEAWESKLAGWLGLGCIQYIKIHIYILTLYLSIIYIIYYSDVLYMYMFINIYIYIYSCVYIIYIFMCIYYLYIHVYILDILHLAVTAHYEI